MDSRQRHGSRALAFPLQGAAVPEKPTADDIMAAINSSGYLMEQEVATQLEKLGYHVRTNAAFEDPDEGKSREIDVTAVERVGFDEKAKLAAYIELIVECKNNSNPFVFIARPKNQVDVRDGPAEFLFPYSYSMKKPLSGSAYTAKNVSPFVHLGFDKLYPDHLTPWKAVQFCRIDRQGKNWQANHGGLYDAIFYPMAKAVTSRKKSVPRATHVDDWHYFWFFFPLVVTSGDLFLIDATESKPEPRPVDHVTFKRELKSGKLSGLFTLTFVREDRLSDFVSKTVRPIARRARELITNQQDLLKGTELPWIE